MANQQTAHIRNGVIPYHQGSYGHGRRIVHLVLALYPSLALADLGLDGPLKCSWAVPGKERTRCSVW